MNNIPSNENNIIPLKILSMGFVRGCVHYYHFETVEIQKYLQHNEKYDFHKDDVIHFCISMEIPPLEDFGQEEFMGKPWVWLCNLDDFYTQKEKIRGGTVEVNGIVDMHYPKPGLEAKDVLTFGIYC